MAETTRMDTGDRILVLTIRRRSWWPWSRRKVLTVAVESGPVFEPGEAERLAFALMAEITAAGGHVTGFDYGEEPS